MPLNKKGRRIMHKMQEEYGGDKAKKVFYASRNKGAITGVDPESSGRKKTGDVPRGKKRKVRGISYSAA